MEILPAGITAAERRRRRWGGLGPYCIKVEAEVETQEFVEEVVEPPARIPVPVSDPLYALPFPQPGIQLPFLQESCIVQIWQGEEEDSSYHSCEELLLLVPPLSFSSSFQEPSSGIC